MDAHLAFVAVTAVAALTVGLSKGGLPLIGMLAVPVMSLVVPPLEAAGLMLPILVVADMFALYTYRREFDARNLSILIPCALIGVGIGWALAAVIPEVAVTLFVGLIGLGFVFSQLVLRKGLEPRKADLPRGIFWGLVIGITSFVSHSGGPPFQIYVLPQRLPKMMFAGTAAVLFAIVNLSKLVPYWMLGEMSLSSIERIAWYAPVAIASTFLGKYLTRRVPERIYFLAILISLALVSVLLVREGGLGILALLKHA